MIKSFIKVLLFSFLLWVASNQIASAETLEDQLNNLIGPKQQYDTALSPVYLRANQTNESINPQSGELSIAQTDYVLPGRNGLDLEFKRIYKSGVSNVQEMNVKYVNGAWVDYVQSDAKTSSFYEDRYNLGIGMRFSFPQIEVRENGDGTSHKFLHTDSGDVYRLSYRKENGEFAYFPEGQTVKDVVVRESAEYQNNQSDGTSKYVMTGKDGKKIYFAADGRLLGIRDRYGNSQNFEYTDLSYTIDGQTITKKLMSKITDTVGRIVNIEYKEDSVFTVTPITNVQYAAEESWKATQNPNNTDSGDLQGKFQVILHLPGDKTIIYDKSAVLVSSSKHVIRTRLQRVYDMDNKPKFHFWYEQPDLGFTYMNGTQYSVYNRYENLVQIDYPKTNKLKRYVYNNYTKTLNKGSMQYRKIFEQKDLIKKGYDPAQSNFADKFVTEVKNKMNYAYTNEPDGFGFEGYIGYDNLYLRDTYRYFTQTTDVKGNITKYTYDGLNQLLQTENNGTDHKEVLKTERDEMKLIKKKETWSYNVANGQVAGEPVKRIENFRYDEYGNLTNYTGPEAERDEYGVPVNSEHTVVYSYAYDKFHILTLKTWKQDAQTTNQINYDIDASGNVLKETKSNSANNDNKVVTDYAYDGFGNVTKKTISSGGNSFSTQYEYGIDINGTDVKGAYLTKEYRIDGDIESATKYGYDWNTGNRTAEMDPNGNRVTHEYDVLNRLVKTVQADSSSKSFSYEEAPFSNLIVRYKDPADHEFTQEYDITGALLRSSVKDNGVWNILRTMEYDGLGNKTKEIDANGHSTRFEYDSNNRLVRKSMYDKDTVAKGTMTLSYQLGYDAETPLVVTLTDEEGYVKRMYFDRLNRLIKLETTPDNTRFFKTSYTYDYVGNKLTETNPRGYTTSYVYDSLGRMILRRDALGFETENSYNALYQVSRKKEPGGKMTDFLFNALGLVVMRKTYQQGSADYTYVAYEYDKAGGIVREKQGSLLSGEDKVSSDISYAYDTMRRITDEYKRIDETRSSHVKYGYDANGNRTEMIQYADTLETKYRIYTYAYDYAGQLMEESGTYREAIGSGEFQEYGKYRKSYLRDYAGNVIKQSVDNGGGWDTTEEAYNYRNLIVSKKEPYGKLGIKETQYQYDKVGNRISETLTVEGIPLTMTYVYDGLGEMTKRIDSLGNTTRYVYDESGNRIKEIDPRYLALSEDAAPGTETEYDALNRVVKTIAFDGTLREVTKFRVYDGRGNIVKDVNGDGYNDGQPDKSIGILSNYDVNDRRISVISAETAAGNERDGTSNVTQTFIYDGSGRVLSETDAYGNKILNAFYLNGQPKEITYPDNSKEQFDYDLSGKAMSVRTDPLGHVTKTFYNVFDKPYRIEHPDGGVERFSYSTKGELTESNDQLGQLKRFEYDASGNLVAQMEYIGADGTGTSFRRKELGYDEANRNVSKETFLIQGANQSGIGGVKTSSGDRVEYSYDKAGRLLQQAGPFGRETSYVYDQANNIKTKLAKVEDGYYDVWRFEYDSRSRLTKKSLLVKTSDVSPESLAGAEFDNEYADRIISATSYEYTKNGKIKNQTDPRGNVTQYKYDLDGRTIKKIDPLLASMEYRYDLKGRLAEEINARGVTTHYEYDAVDRLILKIAPAAGGGEAITRYLYDGAGNLKREIAPNQYDASKDTADSIMSMPGMSYSYDEMNRRRETISPEGTGLEYVLYDTKGQVLKIVDGLRYTGDISASLGTQFEYDGLGQMVTKTDALGNQTGFAYDVLGNMTKKTDARGYVTEYAYNADNTLASTTFPDGGIANYAYDNLGRKVSEINPLGNTVTYRYNAFGKVKAMVDPYGYSVETKYDLSGNPVSVKDKRGNVTLFKFDANMRLTEKRIPQDQDASGNTIYSIETYVYDPVGNMTKKSLSSSKDRSFLRETSYTYADNNLLLTVSDTSGTYTKNDYDKNGNIVKTEKLRDSSVYDVEKFVYDVRNRLIQRIRLVEESDLADAASWPNIGNLRDNEYPGFIQVISGYEYDVLGNRTKEIDPRAYAYTPDDTAARDTFTVQYTYDVLNRVEKIIRKYQGADVYRKYDYDKVGNRTNERNEQGFETKYTYDGMNRVLTVTDPEQHTFIYGYDLAGNKVTETNAKGYTMSYGYDKLNRLVTVTDPYDRVITRNVLDENGNILKKIDAKGYLSADTDEKRYGWEYVYDLANHPVRVLDPELAMKNKPGSFTWIYEYDPVGEKVKETNALGQTTSYEYNGAGRLVKVTDPVGVSTVYNYDKVGNKLDMTDGRGKLTAYSYGAFGLLRKATNASQKSVGYKYDLALNIAELTDRNGYHTVYTYDSRSMLTGKTVKETGDHIEYEYNEVSKRITMMDDSGTSRYSYDKNYRLQQIVKDGMERITYTYDAIGNIATVKDLTGFTTSYTYDKSSRMDSVSFQGKVTKYQYDDNGNRKAIVYDGGVTEEYSYDRNNRLVNLTNKKPDDSVISSYSYTYNDTGLQTSKTDSFGTTDYAYDDAGRIQQVDAPGKTTVYAYDRAGNRLSLLETYTSAQPSGYVDPSTEADVPYSVKKSEYVYSATNELLKLVETMFDDSGRQVLEKTVSYLYDDNGNELRQQVGYIRPHKKDMRQVTGGSLYGDDQAGASLNVLIEKVNNTFDGFNRLKQTERLKSGERVTVEYTYDGDDLRTRKTVRSSKDNYAVKVTNYLYNRQHVILETDAAGGVSTRYVRGINYIARIDASDKISYYLYNGHGDVVQTVSSNGTVENQYDYDVFGNLTLSVETGYSNAIRYAGEFFDAETGLYYLRARYYNPHTGRFISEDTFKGRENEPLSLNLYTYANNNPSSYIDPSGHDTLAIGGGFVDSVSSTLGGMAEAVKTGVKRGSAALAIPLVVVGGLFGNPKPAGESQEDIDQMKARDLPPLPPVPDVSETTPTFTPVSENVAPAPTVPKTTTYTRPINRDFSLNEDGTYTVKWGDTLGQIADVNGVPMEEIARINNISDINKIREGQTLTLSAPVVDNTKPLVDIFPMIEEEKPKVGQLPLVEEKPKVGQLPLVEEKPTVGELPLVEEKPKIDGFPIVQEGLKILLISLDPSKVGIGKVGDFTGLKGTTIDDILSRIPSDAVGRILTPFEGGSQKGFEYRWQQDGTTWKVRVHDPDPSAPVGSNSAEGWIVRVLQGKKSMDADGVFHPEGIFKKGRSDFYSEKLINDVHIPITAPSTTSGFEGPEPSNSKMNNFSLGGLVWNRYGEVIGYNPYGGSYTDYSDKATETQGGSYRENIAWTTSISDGIGSSHGSSIISDYVEYHPELSTVTLTPISGSSGSSHGSSINSGSSGSNLMSAAAYAVLPSSQAAEKAAQKYRNEHGLF